MMWSNIVTKKKSDGMAHLYSRLDKWGTVCRRLATPALSPSHQFSQRIWYVQVEYHFVHAYMSWNQKFRKSEILLDTWSEKTRRNVP